MIQQQTILKVSDNSGAKTAKCIKVLGGSKKKYAKLGDIIVVSIQELRKYNPKKKPLKIKKGSICRALIIKTKTKHKKLDGSTIFYNTNKNSVILINKRGNPISTRITEPIPFLLKKKKFKKFIGMSPGII